MKPRITTLLAALLAGGLIAAGCGGDDDEDAGDPGPAENPPAQTETESPQETGESGGEGGDVQTLRNPADESGQLAFQKDTLTAKPGTVRLVMENPSALPHAIAVRGGGADSSGQTVDQGETSEVEVDLKAGEYEFYCPVPGHEAGGMKGTLTVE
jgi:plastocyanin